MEENGSNTKKILIHPDLTRIIQHEFRTTWQTVNAAKQYYNNSALAKKIRARAKELLLEEAAKIEDYA